MNNSGSTETILSEKFVALFVSRSLSGKGEAASIDKNSSHKFPFHNKKTQRATKVVSPSSRRSIWFRVSPNDNYPIAISGMRATTFENSSLAGRSADAKTPRVPGEARPAADGRRRTCSNPPSLANLKLASKEIYREHVTRGHVARLSQTDGVLPAKGASLPGERVRSRARRLPPLNVLY